MLKIKTKVGEIELEQLDIDDPDCDKVRILAENSIYTIYYVNGLELSIKKGSEADEQMRKIVGHRVDINFEKKEEKCQN